MSATEARKKFFDLLDRASRGEAVLIDRRGTVLRLVRGEAEKGKKAKRKADYRKHIRSSVEKADRWSWGWMPAKGLKLKPS